MADKLTPIFDDKIPIDLPYILKLPELPDGWIIGSDDVDRIWGTENADTILLFDGDDVAYGGGSNDNILGGKGNDKLFGDSGEDSLFGGDDNDTLNGGSGADLLDGGDGIDTADYSYRRSGPVTIDLEAGTGHGGDAEGDILVDIENVTGTSRGDTLLGDAGNNVLDGGSGDDTLDGRGGTDTLFGGLGSDTLTGGTGSDLFVFNHRVDGHAEHDVITDFQTDVNGMDQIQMPSHGQFTLADLLADLNDDSDEYYWEEVGRDVVIHTNIEDTITIENVTIADLSAGVSFDIIG